MFYVWKTVLKQSPSLARAHIRLCKVFFDMIRGTTARTKTARTFSIQKQIYWRFNWTRNNLNGISTCFKTRIYYNLRCVKTYWHIYSAFTTRKWCIIWVETKWEQVKGGFSPWMTNHGSRFQSGPWAKGAGLPSLYSRPKSFVLAFSILNCFSSLHCI